MRTIDSSISVLKPSNFAWWHSSWTGRFVLAALLIAAAAFALMPDRTSAQTPPGITDYCKANGDNNGGIPAADVNVDDGKIPQDIFNKVTCKSTVSLC